MKRLAQWFDHYFYCSRRERRGILCLCFLVFALFASAWLYPRLQGEPQPADFGAFEGQIAEFRAQLDTLEAGRRRRYASGGSGKNYTNKPYANKSKPSDKDQRRSLREFEFDPNTASREDLLNLGLPERTVQSLLNYRDKGGRFRRAEDFQKIYNLPEEDYRRLLPYLRLESPAQPAPASGGGTAVFAAQKRETKSYETLEINTARAEQWQALPGIGGVLSERIVKFREALGGFYAVEQVGETFGLPDSTFRRISPYLVCAQPAPLRKLRINEADEAALRAHPYIRPRHARSILGYRQKHGRFATPDLLQTFMEFNDEEQTYKRLRPYLE